MKRFRLIGFLLICILVLAACKGTKSEVNDAVAQGVSATQTKLAWEADQEEARQTEQAQASEPSPEPEIVHELIPGEPTELSNTYVTDFNSIDFANEGITYGDQFIINRFERPFTVEMEEYRGYLDLILANMKVNPPWIYVEIFLADDLPAANQAYYSLEFDTDLDGRGDFLVQAALPEGSDWTVAGVSVFEDQDGDVGGENPILTDPPQDSYTGFEAQLFAEGRGDDPDLAWTRRAPDDPTSLQIVFKQSLIGSGGFLWSVWADEGLRDPGMADYNDRFTFEQAGSPYPEHEFYPIQAINLVDSTCRSWYGFEPEGDQPGLCQVYAPTPRDTGYKLCYTFNLGAGSSTVCNDVCMERCPANLPSPWSCQKCNMPE